MNEAVARVFGPIASMANGAAAFGAGVQAGVNMFDQLQNQSQQMQQNDFWSRRSFPQQMTYVPPVYPWAQQPAPVYGAPQQMGYPGITDPSYGFTTGYTTGFAPSTPMFGSQYANAMCNMTMGGWQY